MATQEVKDAIMSFVLGPTLSLVRDHSPLVHAQWYRRQQQECCRLLNKFSLLTHKTAHGHFWG